MAHLLHRAVDALFAQQMEDRIRRAVRVVLDLVGPGALELELRVKACDLERAFRDPPVSWEQVLHPEKYWNAYGLDLPRPVAIPDLSPKLGDGWALSGEGGLGELILAILTDRRGVAASWQPVSWRCSRAALSPARLRLRRWRRLRRHLRPRCSRCLSRRRC